jgi:[ribosomal protein S5]-alanine N-acetyltransferase
MDEMREFRIQICDTHYLSRITYNDKAAYLEHLTDEEISRNTLRIPYPYTEADADQWLDLCEKNARNPEKLFAIRDATGYLIGGIGIGDDLSEGATAAEFGYWLAKPHRGRGIMTQAISTYTDYAFQHLGLSCLYAIPFINNVASQRVLEKAGFQRESLLPQYHVKNGVQIDAVRYVKSANPARRAD